MSSEHQHIAAGEMSLKSLIQQTILKQKQFLDSEDSHSMSRLSGRQDLWHSGYGQSLATCCKMCGGSVREDPSAKWAVNRPGYYIARHLTCRSTQCQGKQTYFVPLDTNIPWVQNDVEKITCSPKGNTSDWHDCLQKAASNPKLTLPLTVNSWRIHGREHAVLSGKRSIFIDSEP